MRPLFLWVTVLLVTGCTTFGISPREDRSFTTVVSDSTIRVGVLSQWRTLPEVVYSNLELVVHSGRVMVLGCVETPEQQIEAVRLAWRVKGVKEVIDEMTIGQSSKKIGVFAKDTLMTTQLKGVLTFQKGVQSLSYDYKTYGGVVYLIGTAGTFEELQSVLDCARSIKGVREVVNHIRLKGVSEAVNGLTSSAGRAAFLPGADDIQQRDF